MAALTYDIEVTDKASAAFAEIKASADAAAAAINRLHVAVAKLRDIEISIDEPDADDD